MIYSHHTLNSLAPGRFEWNLTQVIFKLILVIDDSYEVALRWILVNLTDKWILVQVMAWFHKEQAIVWVHVGSALCCHKATMS